MLKVYKKLLVCISRHRSPPTSERRPEMSPLIAAQPMSYLRFLNRYEAMYARWPSRPRGLPPAPPSPARRPALTRAAQRKEYSPHRALRLPAAGRRAVSPLFRTCLSAQLVEEQALWRGEGRGGSQRHAFGFTHASGLDGRKAIQTIINNV